MSKSLSATERETFLFVPSHTGKSFFYYFHMISQDLRPEGVIRSFNLSCCELQVTSSILPGDFELKHSSPQAAKPLGNRRNGLKQYLRLL